MKISEIVHDILEDMNTLDSRLSGNGFANSHRRGGNNLGTIIYLLPNILGFLFGCAIARFFLLPLIFYLIFGIICSVAGGTYISVTKEEISLKYAIIRHCLIVGFITAIVGFVFLTEI